MFRIMLYGVLALVLLGGIIILIARYIPKLERRLLRQAEKDKISDQVEDVMSGMNSVESAERIGDHARTVDSKKGDRSEARVDRDCKDAEKVLRAGKKARSGINKLVGR